MTGRTANLRRSARGLAEVALRYSLGFVWLTSGLAKLTLPHAFLAQVYQCQIVSPLQGVIMAAVLPVLEILLALLLLAGVSTPAAACISSGLLAVFSIAKSYALWAGLEIGCGCFGALGQDQLDLGSLAMTLLLLALSVSLAVLTRGRRVLETAGFSDARAAAVA